MSLVRRKCCCVVGLWQVHRWGGSKAGGGERIGPPGDVGEILNREVALGGGKVRYVIRIVFDGNLAARNPVQKVRKDVT